ncbi:zinc ribbon domain-containing protein [Crassaminicella profunda]|uniref:zinc ribbon domain-containing protein n=1 Tax=Crassaminicella profunda TaxID=1286698 RepID=UPI001CA6D0A3|nr:zinc ribbon domain-containing protein [Crassaminicella profunda]QZY56356.1 zinc ribbon domain-containing protein [Crassaminicella profunda]
MDIFDKLADKVSYGTKKISQKTDEIIEITELKMDLKNIEDEIEEAKLYIGELVYKYFLANDNSMPVSQIKGKCREIQRMETQKNRVKTRLYRIKGLTYCRFCGEAIDDEENYCSKCGHKINRY